MSKREFLHRLDEKSEATLAELGMNKQQVNAVSLHTVSADSIIHTKNLSVLRQVPYFDIYKDPQLVKDYDLLEQGCTDIEAATRMMRETHLASAVIARSIHVGEDDGWLFDTVQSYINQAMVFQPRIDQASGDTQLNPIKVKEVSNAALGHLGIQSFVVKKSVGTLKDYSNINILERKVFAGLDEAREIDLKDKLGIAQRHVNDRRPVPRIVPISTAYLAHR